MPLNNLNVIRLVNILRHDSHQPQMQVVRVILQLQYSQTGLSSTNMQVVRIILQLQFSLT